jgi:DNA polymerase phi
LARDIPWLREECGLVLVEVVKSVATHCASEECVRQLVQRLVDHKLTNTPEGVAIWLTARALHPESLPSGIWHANDPLHKKERARLAKILKEDFRDTSENGSEQKIKSAAANPNPIFAWDLVISDVLQRDGNSQEDRKDSDKAEFPQFWIDAVDSKSDPDREIHTYLLTQIICSHHRLLMSASHGASSFLQPWSQQLPNGHSLHFLVQTSCVA